MRRLERDRVSPPSCLSKYRHGANSWSDVTEDDRRELKQALIALQGLRCAYCECELPEASPHDRSHIEHFFQRSAVPQFTFAWPNLFRSCTFDERCGRLKDRVTPAAQMDVVLKPDVDDPALFIKCSAADGRFVALPDLEPLAVARADETIRVFALNSDALLYQRKPRIAAARQDAEEIAALGPATDPAIKDLYDALLADLAGTPFEGGVRSALT